MMKEKGDEKMRKEEGEMRRERGGETERNEWFSEIRKRDEMAHCGKFLRLFICPKGKNIF